MIARARTATAMAFRDQRRRPLVLILLVIVPAYVITRSLAITQATSRRIDLPGGVHITTTMKDMHGAVMAGTVIAFVAGFRAGEAIFARLAVLTAATALVVAVSAIVTAFNFTPASWPPLLAALVLIGLIYAALGALAGALLEKLAATYLILFLAITDLGIVQNPMFGNGAPGRWAVLLPGYGPARMMVDGAFSASFHTGSALLAGVAWLAVLALSVNVALRRAIGMHARRDTRATASAAPR